MSTIVEIPLVDAFDNEITLKGYLTISNVKVDKIPSLVIFVHGSGSSKDSPRNQYLAQQLNKCGIGTFLFDLLTKQEEESDRRVQGTLQKEIHGLTLNKFNVSLLSDRLTKVTNYLLQIPNLQPQGQPRELSIGYFGASTGAAAALIAGAQLSLNTKWIKTIVSRGGRPDLILSNSNVSYQDLISESIRNLPILFIIGEKDKLILDLTFKFIKKLNMQKNSKVEKVNNATHLFEEPGALEKVEYIAEKWFLQYL
jgi:hypothetical protein